ncbi:hypothetical protein DFH07DRAFT_769461 [Mycena maculata]|uniref:Uncharacterized protein n=1 Tax=Mycena maculata TaxID=230809 RepID=A0AAD7JMW0_9AGAR|nr:hypothetical protein DFH07DRAFT_769461 [Mycena maculata]
MVHGRRGGRKSIAGECELLTSARDGSALSLTPAIVSISSDFDVKQCIELITVSPQNIGSKLGCSTTVQLVPKIKLTRLTQKLTQHASASLLRQNPLRVTFSACKTGLRPRKRAFSGLGLDFGVAPSPSPAFQLASPFARLAEKRACAYFSFPTYGKYTVQKDFTSSRDGCNNNFAFGTQILDNLTKLQLQNCSNSGFQNFPMDNFAWVQLQQDATLKCNGCNFRQGHLIEETTLL